MRKSIKIPIISLASLIGLVLLLFGVACFLVFTPARLTALVRKEAPRFITCEMQLDRVELTLFKTFPRVGLDIQNVTLSNPMPGAPSDTVLHLSHCQVALNLRKLLNEQCIDVQTLTLKEGDANLFFNPDGQSNLDIFKTDTTTTSSEFNYALDVRKVVAKDLDIRYVDLANQMSVQVLDVDLKARAHWDSDLANGKLKLSSHQLAFNMLDSSAMKVSYENLDFRFDGSMEHLDKVDGDLKLDIRQLCLSLAEDTYVDRQDIGLETRMNVLLSEQKFAIQELLLQLGKHKLNIDGTVQRNADNGDLALDVNYKTRKWPIEEVLSLVPESLLGDVLEGMTIAGKVGLSGTVRGHYNDHQWPVVQTSVELSDGSFSMKDFPFDLKKIGALVTLNLDLNGKSDVKVQHLECYSGKNHLTASGTVKDVLDKMRCDVSATATLHLADFQQLLPENIHRCQGDARVQLKAAFDKSQVMDMNLDKMRLDGTIQLKQFDLNYDDLAVQAPDMLVEVRFPVQEHPYNIAEWAEAKITASRITGSQSGTGDVLATGAHIDAFVSSAMDFDQLKAGLTYQFDNLTARLDTIDATLQQSSGQFVMRAGKKMSLKHDCASLLAHYGNTLTAQSQRLDLQAQATYDKDEEELLLQWNPTAKIKLNEGNITAQGLPFPIIITQFDGDLDLSKCDIRKVSGRFGHSDATLSGQIYNIDKYLEEKGMLTGTLQLNSDYLDLNEILDIFNGMSAPDTLLAEETEHKEDNPFIVPYAMDVRLNTNIKKAHYEDVDVRSIGGKVTVKDGVLVLDEMGFTSDAARMQLTALYKTPRRNHLFLGLDFHLLDIKIAELIQMIPEVDTVLPMLKSFAGNAEFHFAVETYLKSNYELKFSTLRGAAAIHGQDLVVLDNDTYKKISKLLMFKKGTPNKIDSLSAEVTIFRNEVDVYPFSVSIDKYQAILSGRHNLNMTYDYNISLVKPIRLGLDIIGTDKLKFKVGKPKYATMFRPEKQNVVEQNVLQLKNNIHNALKANVKEQPVEQ